jgi:hypothetical protein
VQPILEFLTTTGGKIVGIIAGALVVIIIVAWVDRHPSQKKQGPIVKEPRRDDE